MATFRPKPAKSNDENEDSSEGLTVPTAKDAENFVSQIKKYISRGNNPQQLAMGGVSGWLTGYMAMKIGKTVATAVGGSLILLQIASYKGYININWSKVNKDIEGAQKKLLKHSSDPSVPQLLDKASDYLEKKVGQASKKKNEAKRWYRHFVHGKDTFELGPLQAFYVGFVSGSLAGTFTGLVL